MIESNVSENSGLASLVRLLELPIVRVLFLATFTIVVFFIGEHKISMSKTQNFVEHIENQESWAAGGNKARQIAFVLCAVIGMLCLLLGRAGKFRWSLPAVLVMAYIAWAGLSYTWSIDTGATMRRYVVMLCCLMGCFGYCRYIRVQDAALCAVLVSLAYLIIGLGAELFYGSFRPHLGEHRFAGTIHPNNQAANLAIGAIGAYTLSRVTPDKKYLFYALFGVFFLFLILTKCRSATATVPVALGVIWFTAQPRQNIFIGLSGSIFLASALGLVCVMFGFDPVSEYQDVLLMGRGEETGSSLTGRLPLWEDLFVYISFKPWLGYGFGAFWTPAHIYSIAVSQEWVISEAHSSYIDATLQLGLIGGSLLALTAIITFVYAALTFRKTQRPEYLFLVGGAVFCIVRGFTESGVHAPAAFSSHLFMALAAHSWHVPKKPIDRTVNANNDLAGPAINPYSVRSRPLPE